ncbi:PA14 domain-containing protein [Paludisphaera mucosa]|uniref:PA14 domain-containing protein n=1 Tax=Paludisphaera mucosa TaxID=3030827 RepID=A0ABT6F401_9BACT|nr:PA14 domain-containing protein [Paludisphaera mucosa]MDG3002249.1 PA14 domain-containing protein [Paludisphaera mucosa]
MNTQRSNSILIVAAVAAALLATPRGARAEFVVRDVQSTGPIRSLADADALLAGSGVARQTTATAAVINYTDESPIGRFGDDAGFPDSLAIGSSRDDFAIHATATIFIDSAGTYTFGTNSDDGVRLRIDAGGGLQNVIDDSGIHGATDNFGVVTFASAGAYTLDLVFFEGYGEASVELFAAKGSYGSWGDTSSWRLVGDAAGGGISTVGPTAIPEPSSIMMAGLGFVGLLSGVKHSHRRKQM